MCCQILTVLNGRFGNKSDFDITPSTRNAVNQPKHVLLSEVLQQFCNGNMMLMWLISKDNYTQAQVKCNNKVKHYEYSGFGLFSHK